METIFPYTRYACHCNEHLNEPSVSVLSKRVSQPESPPEQQPETEGQLFNPHDARANYSLFPLDQLLFCDECNAMSCAKCWSEETMYWYCPSCQFEVPSSGVKQDGNRCTRSCYDCPLCSANLSVTAIKQSETHLRPTDSSTYSGEYVLHCSYCDWSSLDMDLRFAKPNKITEQLSRLWKMRIAAPVEDEVDKSQPTTNPGPLHHDTAFANLSKFYKEQLTDLTDQSNPFSNSPYSSPANLARIMNLYSTMNYKGLKKTQEKPQPMREAGNQAEGLSTYTANTSEDELVRKMAKVGIEGTASVDQQLVSPYNYVARFTDELWPVATRLRTKRGKRCRGCRQFLARPESKVPSMKYKIRLLALNLIPRLILQPKTPGSRKLFKLRQEPAEDTKLRPYLTEQFVLTVRNPIFETVKVTLATPTTTPGKVASKITILCPSFTVGPAGDRWDEALDSSNISAGSDGSRRAAMASLAGGTDNERQAEAGKVWEKTRNSTSVILEIVPGSLNRHRPSIVSQSDQQQEEEEVLAEDDDVLEVPIYVRVEWEAEPTEAAMKNTGEKVQKELAYWTVIGIGRIADG